MSNRPLMAREEQKVQDELQDQFKHVYTPGTPITEPALFGGRHQLLETVRLTQGVGMNYVIQGPAGLGKTSFARQLFCGAGAFWHTASEDTDFVSFFLQCFFRSMGR
jgi:transcriptional regulator with AAA-type ATPase domain